MVGQHRAPTAAARVASPVLRHGLVLPRVVVGDVGGEPPREAFAFDDDFSFGIIQSGPHWEWTKAKGGKVAGQPIRDLVTVNGVRVTCEDGSWGLVRASSNKPELVVVVESPVSEKRMRDMFEAMDSVLRTHPDVGEYNQKI